MRKRSNQHLDATPDVEKDSVDLSLTPPHWSNMEGPNETTTSGANQNQHITPPNVPNNSNSTLNADSRWNDLTEMLHTFQSAHRLTRKAMNGLLKITERARQFPNERLNMDWRTVLAHKTKHDLGVLKRTVGTKHAATTEMDEDVFVCSACALTSFTIDEMAKCVCALLGWESTV